MSAKNALAQAYYDLATMLDAGMPILRSLDIVIEGRQGFFKRAFWRLRETISKGSSLAEAMEGQPHVFRDLDRMLVEAAETSGSMSDAFQMLADWYEFVHRITRRMQAGLIYPLLILHMGVFIAAVPTVVISGFTPWRFAMLIVRPLLFFYIPALVVIVFILLRDRVPALRWSLDFLVLRIPVLGLAVYQMSICRYAKAFGMLYKAGVPMMECVTRANRAAGNEVVARQFAGAIESVRQGGLACKGFSPRLPNEYRQLWEIGEETGELDRTVGKIAEISGDRANLLFTEFARWMPRVIYFAIVIYLAVRVLQLWQQVYGRMGAF